ncbi:MAG TPA: hypothetical protein VNZ03_06280 [Terriglobales bacterium]|nr:hypothetical protein [Terriglobales bacterium]
MQIIGVDLHTRQQTVAMLNVETGEIVEKTLQHEGDSVREFYSTLAGPTRVGIEATGSMQWFLALMEELGIDCQVGHPAKIRAAGRIAIAVSATRATDRRLKPKGRRVGLAAPPGTTADDSSRSGTDYGSGDGNLFG